jgi:hypothetical protein
MNVSANYKNEPVLGDFLGIRSSFERAFTQETGHYFSQLV